MFFPTEASYKKQNKLERKLKKTLFIMILLLMYFNSSEMFSGTSNYFRSHCVLKPEVISNCNSHMLLAVLLLVLGPIWLNILQWRCIELPTSFFKVCLRKYELLLYLHNIIIFVLSLSPVDLAFLFVCKSAVFILSIFNISFFTYFINVSTGKHILKHFNEQHSCWILLGISHCSRTEVYTYLFYKYT